MSTYRYLPLVGEISRLAAQWEREDRELADARSSLPYEERDAAQEQAENDRINARRDKAVKMLIVAVHVVALMVGKVNTEWLWAIPYPSAVRSPVRQHTAWKAAATKDNVDGVSGRWVFVKLYDSAGKFVQGGWVQESALGVGRVEL